MGAEVNYQYTYPVSTSTTGWWPEEVCSCGYDGPHTWVGHWFRLLWTRRIW